MPGQWTLRARRGSSQSASVLPHGRWTDVVRAVLSDSRRLREAAAWLDRHCLRPLACDFGCGASKAEDVRHVCN
eukprot:5705900-Alexandrium_andersonii.AAC.1